MVALKKGISKLSDFADGNAAHGHPGDYYGQIYFVNNITGDSGYDGLSWATPFDEISTAITASEAFRQLPSGTTNDYQRNIIYVQGTGTAYSALTALPSYCDLIGIGANPRGNGSGICKIVNESSGDAIAVGSAGVRGLYMSGFQVGCTVTSGTAGYAMDLDKIFRSEFENCVFWNKLTGAVRLVLCGSVTFRNCQIGGGDTSNPLIGLNQSGSSHFNNCLIEDCFIHGATTGVVVTAMNCHQTWFKDNYIYGGTKGVDDNATNQSVGLYAIYTGNRVYSASDCFEITTGDGVKAFGNLANQAGTTAHEDALG